MNRIAKFNLILEKLIDRTQEGKIIWSETADPEVFITNVDTIGVIVKRSNMGWGGSESFKVEILNSDGMMADEVPTNGAMRARRETPDKSAASKLNDSIKLLHTLARRSALNADATLDDLVHQLDAIR